MTAELLREAAALMRERAEAATAPKHPWAVDGEDDQIGIRARRGAGPTVAVTIPLGYEERRANATHIASWHPAVALAVADWLDSEAAAVDTLAAAGVARQFDSAWVASETDKRHGSALAVARNYLGRP